MKKQIFLIIFLLVGFMSSTVQAGFKAAIGFDRTTVLTYESVLVNIVLHNDTDEIFTINKKNEYNDTDIFLEVKRKGKKKEVLQIKEGAMLSRLSMYPDDKRTIVIDLSEWYSLSKPGHYIVTLVIKWRGKTYTAEKAAFEVVTGIELVSVKKNLPGYFERIRTYSLRYWARKKSEFIFLVVSDEETNENWTFLIGHVIRVFPPELKVNNRGLVSIVHQTGPDCYVRTSFESSKDGMFFINQTYHLPDGDKYPAERLRETFHVSREPEVNQKSNND